MSSTAKLNELNILLKEKNFDKALRLVTQLSNEDWTQLNQNNKLGKALLKLSRNIPDDITPEQLFQFARIYQQRNNLRAYKALLKEILRREPNHEAANNDLAKLGVTANFPEGPPQEITSTSAPEEPRPQEITSTSTPVEPPPETKPLGCLQRIQFVGNGVKWFVDFFNSIVGIIAGLAGLGQTAATVVTVVVTVIAIGGGTVVVTNMVNNEQVPVQQVKEIIESIDEIPEIDQYTIDGEVGKHLYLEVIPNQGGTGCCLNWRLLDPDQIQIFDAEYASRQVILEKDGKYILEVESKTNYEGKYAFRIHTIAYDTFNINVGDTISPSTAKNAGDIELPGDQDIYNVELQEGQRIFLQTLNGTGYSSYDGLGWRIYDPDGVNILDVSYSDVVLNPDKSGTYKIIIRGTNNFTQQYSFKIWLIEPDTFEVEIGQTISSDTTEGAGHIELAGETDIYSLDLSEGQRIFLQTLNGTGYSSYDGLGWRIYDPDGVNILDASYSDVVLNPDKSGTYKIIIRGTNNFTQQYSFKIWLIEPDTFEVEIGQTISSDTTEGAGHIELAGETDIYSLDLSADQSIQLIPLNGTGYSSYDGLGWLVYDSHGTQLHDGSYQKLEFTANDTGIYKIIVYGTNLFTQKYSFEISSN